jgi:hypothetical protein
LVALGLAGLQDHPSDPPATAVIAAEPRYEGEARNAAAACGERHKANPSDPEAGAHGLN